MGIFLIIVLIVGGLICVSALSGRKKPPSSSKRMPKEHFEDWTGLQAYSGRRPCEHGRAVRRIAMHALPENILGYPRCPECRSINQRGEPQKVWRDGNGYRCILDHRYTGTV